MKITRTSQMSGEIRCIEIPCTQEQLDAWNNGALIQEAMPGLNADHREFIMTGITAEEWASAFPDDEEQEENYVSDQEFKDACAVIEGNYRDIH